MHSLHCHLETAVSLCAFSHLDLISVAVLRQLSTSVLEAAVSLCAGILGLSAQPNGMYGSSSSLVLWYSQIGKEADTAS